MDTHTCKNCGAVENLKTGELKYNGDNPLLKENQELKTALKTLEVKNKYLAKLAAGKRAKKQPIISITTEENEKNGKKKENPWHF